MYFMLEQRLSSRLVGIWDKLAELNPPPMFAQMNRATISDIWPQCAVIRIEQAAESPQDTLFAFEYIGEKSRSLLPAIQEGQMVRLRELNRETKKYLETLPETIDNITTMVNSGVVAGGRNNKLIKYRICMLPFTNTSKAVSHIMIGFSWIEC
jgi:hypothetical protein